MTEILKKRQPSSASQAATTNYALAPEGLRQTLKATLFVIIAKLLIWITLLVSTEFLLALIKLFAKHSGLLDIPFIDNLIKGTEILVLLGTIPYFIVHVLRELRFEHEMSMKLDKKAGAE